MSRRRRLALRVLAATLALLALIAWPFVWLLSLPFRLLGITLSKFEGEEDEEAAEAAPADLLSLL